MTELHTDFENNQNKSLLRKYKKFFSGVFIILIIIIFFLVTLNIVSNSKPGDLLFAIKQNQETQNNSENVEDQIDHQLNIINDRIFAINSLDSLNNCVQLVLGEDSLVTNLKNTNTLIKSSELNSNFEKVYSAISKLEINNCTLRKETLSLDMIYKILAIKNNSKAINQNDEVVKIKNTYSDFVEQIKTSAFTDQSKLNEINELMLKADQNIQMFDPLLSSNDYVSLNKYINQNIFIYGHLETLMNGEQTTISQHDVIEGICMISEISPDCTSSRINSNWNSITSRKTIIEQIEAGQKVIDEYLLLLLKTN